MVRVSHENTAFKRAYNEQFSKEIFRVAQMYKIKDFSNELVKGNFNGSELQKVNKNKDSLWVIDKQIRKRSVNGKVEYMVSYAVVSSDSSLQYFPQNKAYHFKCHLNTSLKFGGTLESSFTGNKYFD